MTQVGDGDRPGLSSALAAGEIQAWFQPVVALPSGALRGYEALVRWVRADGAPAEPASFIPSASADELLALDRAVLAEAVGVLARLKDRRHVAVNLSLASLASADLVEHVTDTLDAAHVAASRLRLEVPAGALHDLTDAGRAAMRALSDQGVAWYVDGAGAAPSSADDLEGLPVAGIKLDPACAAELGPADSDGARSSRGVVRIAHELGLDTVAGGIETRSAAEALASHGWAHGQGWLFGRPMPADLVR